MQAEDSSHSVFFQLGLTSDLTRQAEVDRSVAIETYFKWSLLPDQVPSHPKGVLVDSNHLRSQQNLLCLFAQLAQICPNEEGRFEERPQGKMTALLIDCQPWIANLCHRLLLESLRQLCDHKAHDTQCTVPAVT